MLDTTAMAEQLSGEYRSAFERADIYSTGTMEEERLDEKMMELYKLLMEAEQNNQPVEDVVGNDFELFCKKLFKERGSFLGDFSEKKRSKREKKEFNKELRDKSKFNTVAQVMAGRFCRIRKRKQKRGQEYTFQDFAQLIRKENKFVKIISFITVIIVAFILFVPVIEIMMEKTIVEGLRALLAVGLFEYFIWCVCFRWNVKSMRMQLSIVEECEQNGKDIMEYLEEAESDDID